MGEGVPGGGEKFSARRGEADAPGFAAEQVVADFALQAADLLTQRRLGDAQTSGRAAEVEFLGEHDEGVQLRQGKFRTLHTLRDITPHLKAY
ncbi:hypothetical protein Shyd_85220 [Streptomyces hydrogenans]|uniref:Uncharacterized protein n=1 Tax=Streptomyces hydrogenans TaxID=1873719 RepID=A0ABQ3PQ58_9ACTN|nr:hypothetical protein GCM10018784_48410 [Streptomyces hydrogenans]GHI27151.1 hypothetical protein Shyd_85220 [Streptomyces hydrogenans]